MNKPTRKDIVNVAYFTTGVALAVTTYQLGMKTGVKLDSMTKDLVAHQLILTNMRAANPELVDKAITETVNQLNAIVAAANS